ncbi:MAG: hypothetical protein FWC03_01930 [Treponema sp.]|nr:hypothetical protein [Treponema sp.]
MNKIFRIILPLIAILAFFAFIGCNSVPKTDSTSLPKLETVADWSWDMDTFPVDIIPGQLKTIPWLPEILPEDWNAARTWGLMYDDEFLGVGLGIGSADTIAIEAAKYWATVGLLIAMLGEPEDAKISHYPDMVYELNNSVKIQIMRLGKTIDNEVVCIAAIDKTEADKIIDMLREKWSILYDSSKPRYFDAEERMNDILLVPPMATFNAEERMKEAFDR